MTGRELEAPRRIKYGLAVLYILIVLAGSYIGRESWLGTEGVHYLASRRNILNQVFVKRGWFWFTLVFWASFIGRKKAGRPGVKLQSAALRYAVATLWWTLFTQWFFGPPIMDRAFTVTGGACVITPEVSTITRAVTEAATSTASPTAADVSRSAAEFAAPLVRRAADIIQKVPKTSSRCRGTGGTWVGGHDPSGHVFLLVHSSMVMWMETLPTLIAERRAGQHLGWETTLPLGYLGLWAFMLFLTAVYFHSFAEKLSGLLFGLFAVFVVYIRGETASWGHWFGVGSHEVRTAAPQSVAAEASAESAASLQDKPEGSL